MQILSLCRSRLRDLSKEGVRHAFDDLLKIPPGGYGVSPLYRILKKRFIKTSSTLIVRSWEGMLDGANQVKMILEDWNNVRKHIVCEQWRETHFKFMH